MNIRDLIKPAPLTFNWTINSKSGNHELELFPDLWGSVTVSGDGCCSYTVCNRATERCPSVEIAKQRVEDWMERIVSERISDAIRKIEAHCIPT